MTGDTDIVEYAIHGRLPLADRTYDDPDAYWLQARAYAHTYACNKLFRSTLFRDIRFPAGRVFEDAYTLPLLLRRARRVVTTSHGYYHYYDNPEGITALADGTQLAQLLDAHLSNGMPVDDLYYMHLVNIQIDVCEQTGRAVTLPSRHVDPRGLTGSKKLKALALNLLGINTLCTISQLLHRVRKPSRS